MRRHGLLVVVVIAGCATTAKPDTTFRDQFPTRAALEKIAATPPPTKLVRDSGLPAEHWQLAGPLPDAIEPLLYSDTSPWGQWLANATAAQKSATLTTPLSLYCVARETGRFVLARQALPDERLGAFIAARCGAFGGDIVTPYMIGTAGARGNDEALFAQAQPQVEKYFAQLVGAGRQQFGVWLGRDNGHVVLILAAGARRAELEHTALVPDASGTVSVSGFVTEQVDHVEAIINRGHFGFARCSVDPMRALPRFVVRCPTDAADASSWLEIASFPRGRVLGHVIARLLVWPKGTPSPDYEQADYVHRSLVAGPDPRQQLLELINGVRGDAGLPLVTLADRESVVAAEMAPHYFGAIAGAEPETVADQIILGLRAGWDVGGDLSRGDFADGIIDRSLDLGKLMDSVLERPGAREALLARDVFSVALGPLVVPDKQIVGLIAGSYELMKETDPVADAKRVMGRLTKARVDAHQPPPRFDHGLDSYVTDAVHRVERGQLSSHDALHDMLERSVQWRRGVRILGWMIEASTIEDLTFPLDMIGAHISGAAIAVGHYRPAGAPWSRLIIFVLAQEADEGVRAARDVSRF